MNLAKLKYLEYVAREVERLAELKHPNNPRLQRIYMIGFMRAQLTEAVYNDSKVFNNFKRAIELAASNTK